MLTVPLLTGGASQVNVYRTGDFFKAHADTPHLSERDGERAFASLVILLPTPFEGGGLVVRHGGHEAALAGAPVPAPGLNAPVPVGGSVALRWAAFYSDCEHEVIGAERCGRGRPSTPTVSMKRWACTRLLPAPFSRASQSLPPPSPPRALQVLPVVAGTRVSITYDVFRRESASPHHLGTGMATEAAPVASLQPPSVELGVHSTPPFLASALVEAAGLLASASLAQAGKRSRIAWEGGDDGDSSAAAAATAAPAAGTAAATPASAPAAAAAASAAASATPAVSAAAADAASPSLASAQAVSSGTVSSALAAAFADPRLLPFGGSLVYHCAHRYPHTAAELAGGSERLLATALKGVDAVVLAAARACGASLSLVPLLVLMNQWNEPGQGILSAAEAVELLRRKEEEEEDDSDEEEEDEEEYIMKKSLRGVTDPARFAAALADSEREAEEAAAHRAATDAGVTAGLPHTVAGVARGAAPAPRGAKKHAYLHELLALRTLRAEGVEFGSNRAIGMLSELSPPLCSADCCENDYSVLSQYGPVVNQLPASTRVTLAPRPLVELNDLPTDRGRLALQGMGMVQGNDAGHPDFLYSVLALVIAVPSAGDLLRGGDGTGSVDVEISDPRRRRGGDDDTSVIYVESSDSEGSVVVQHQQVPALAAPPSAVAVASPARVSSASHWHLAAEPGAAKPVFDDCDNDDEPFDSDSEPQVDSLAAPPARRSTPPEQRVELVPAAVPPESPPQGEVRSSCQCQ